MALRRPAKSLGTRLLRASLSETGSFHDHWVSQQWGTGVAECCRSRLVEKHKKKDNRPSNNGFSQWPIALPQQIFQGSAMTAQRLPRNSCTFVLHISFSVRKQIQYKWQTRVESRPEYYQILGPRWG